MNLLGNFFNHKKENRHLVFDISSGTVAGALISSDDSGKVTLLKAHREFFPFNRPLSGKSIHSTMIHALDKVLSDLSKSAGKVESADFIFSSPWLSSETKKVIIDFTVPTVVTEGIVKEAIEEEERKFAELIDSAKTEKITLLESKVTDIKVNGYSVNNAYGQKAKKLELSIFISISTEKIIKEVKSALSKHFHVAKINLHSEAQTLQSYLSGMEGIGNNYVFINVHGEVTEFIHVNHDHIVAWATIPIGTRTLMRRYAEKCKISNHMAMSDISLVVNGVLDNVVTESKMDVLGKIQDDWINETKEVISTFTTESSVPEKFHLYADSGMHLAFSKLFSTKVLGTLGFENTDDKVTCFRELTETDGILKMGIKSISHLIVK